MDVTLSQEKGAQRNAGSCVPTVEPGQEKQETNAARRIVTKISLSINSEIASPPNLSCKARLRALVLDYPFTSLNTYQILQQDQ